MIHYIIILIFVCASNAWCAAEITSEEIEEREKTPFHITSDLKFVFRPNEAMKDSSFSVVKDRLSSVVVLKETGLMDLWFTLTSSYVFDNHQEKHVCLLVKDGFWSNVLEEKRPASIMKKRCQIVQKILKAAWPPFVVPEVILFPNWKEEVQAFAEKRTVVIAKLGGTENRKDFFVSEKTFNSYKCLLGQKLEYSKEGVEPERASLAEFEFFKELLFLQEISPESTILCEPCVLDKFSELAQKTSLLEGQVAFLSKIKNFEAGVFDVDESYFQGVSFCQDALDILGLQDEKERSERKKELDSLAATLILTGCVLTAYDFDSCKKNQSCCLEWFLQKKGVTARIKEIWSKVSISPRERGEACLLIVERLVPMISRDVLQKIKDKIIEQESFKNFPNFGENSEKFKSLRVLIEEKQKLKKGRFFEQLLLCEIFQETLSLASGDETLKLDDLMKKTYLATSCFKSLSLEVGEFFFRGVEGKKKVDVITEIIIKPLEREIERQEKRSKNAFVYEMRCLQQKKGIEGGETALELAQVNGKEMLRFCSEDYKPRGRREKLLHEVLAQKKRGHPLRDVDLFF